MDEETSKQIEVYLLKALSKVSTAHNETNELSSDMKLIVCRIQQARRMLKYALDTIENQEN